MPCTPCQLAIGILVLAIAIGLVVAVVNYLRSAQERKPDNASLGRALFEAVAREGAGSILRLVSVDCDSIPLLRLPAKGIARFIASDSRRLGQNQAHLAASTALFGDVKGITAISVATGIRAIEIPICVE